MPCFWRVEGLGLMEFCLIKGEQIALIVPCFWIVVNGGAKGQLGYVLADGL